LVAAIRSCPNPSGQDAPQKKQPNHQFRLGELLCPGLKFGRLS
jgi:hypothetical protein